MNSVNPKAKSMGIPSQAKSHLLEGVETTGGKKDYLNNQI
jgi:hypothetical protein